MSGRAFALMNCFFFFFCMSNSYGFFSSRIIQLFIHSLLPRWIEREHTPMIISNPKWWMMARCSSVSICTDNVMLIVETKECREEITGCHHRAWCAHLDYLHLLSLTRHTLTRTQIVEHLKWIFYWPLDVFFTQLCSISASPWRSLFSWISDK